MAYDRMTRRDSLALGAAAALSGSGPAPSGASSAAGAGSTPAAAPTSLAAPGSASVDRAFLRLAEGLVHYRHGGDAYRGGRRSATSPPVYLAHAGPGSSRAFEPLIVALASRRFVFAPDMLGNGDSSPPAREDLRIADYVDAALRVMDTLGLERVDFLGAHTGAQIGVELAIAHPGRVRRLILDGIPLFTEEFRQKLLRDYAPKKAPDDYGTHLIWAWNFVRDQQLYWPWFDRAAENRLSNAVAGAAQLHPGVVDVVKALGTYHIAYRAAFRQDTRALLPQLACPVMISASERDPLSLYLDDAAALIPGAVKRRFARDSTLADRVAAIEAFLAS